MKGLVRKFFVGIGQAFPLDEEAFNQSQHKIFQCGKCSFDDVLIFHNVVGQHEHIVHAAFKAKLAEFDKGGNMENGG